MRRNIQKGTNRYFKQRNNTETIVKFCLQQTMIMVMIMIVNKESHKTP